jgi:hypothetical protein
MNLMNHNRMKNIEKEKEKKEKNENNNNYNNQNTSFSRIGRDPITNKPIINRNYSKFRDLITNKEELSKILSQHNQQNQQF